MINLYPFGFDSGVNDDRVVLVSFEDNRRVNEDRIRWDACVNDDRIGLVYSINNDAVKGARSRIIWLAYISGLTSEHRLLPTRVSSLLRPAATDLEDLLL
jgi:hypothetical protein